MKDFFKRNLVIIILSIVCLGLLFMGSFLFVLSVVGLIGFGGIFIYLAVKSKQRYNRLRDESNLSDGDYFDATKLDYDEDVYYLGSNEKRNKKIAKNALSQFNAMMPTIAFAILGLGCFAISISSLIRIFI